MPIEKRTHIEIFLPVRSDLLGYQTALEWLAEELAYARGGTTLTSPFAGLFASAAQVDIIHDAVRILFCDFELDCEKEDDLADIEVFLENAKIF